MATMTPARPRRPPFAQRQGSHPRLGTGNPIVAANPAPSVERDALPATIVAPVARTSTDTGARPAEPWSGTVTVRPAPTVTGAGARARGPCGPNRVNVTSAGVLPGFCTRTSPRPPPGGMEGR